MVAYAVHCFAVQKEKQMKASHESHSKRAKTNHSENEPKSFHEPLSGRGGKASELDRQRAVTAGEQYLSSLAWQQPGE